MCVDSTTLSPASPPNITSFNESVASNSLLKHSRRTMCSGTISISDATLRCCNVELQLWPPAATIRFCNKNKDKSPIGLEKYDEVIIERSLSAQDEKNKFTVNGKIKKNNEIKEMFKQIRLNVDNFSTFFVQQGKVAEIVKF